MQWFNGISQRLHGLRENPFNAHTSPINRSYVACLRHICATTNVSHFVCTFQLPGAKSVASSFQHSVRVTFTPFTLESYLSSGFCKINLFIQVHGLFLFHILQFIDKSKCIR